MRRAPSWIGEAVAVVTLGGCASTIRETFARAPRALDSDPDSTALVVIDCFISRGSWLGHEDLMLHGAHLRGPDGATDRFEPVLRIKFEDQGILFAGLPPGRYRITELVGTTMVYNVNMKQQVTQLVGCNVSRASDLAFDVAPSAMLYVGRFTASVRGRKVDVEWYPSPARERRVWAAIRDRYSPSPWDAALDRKVASLDSLVGR